MTSADAMRASDNDRELVVQALQEQVGEGRLTLGEFDQRSTDAYAVAKTVGDLRELTSDLPVDPLAPPPKPTPPLASWQQPYPLPAVAPWAQRAYPSGRDYGPPVRRVNPVRIAAAALISLWIVVAVVGAIFHVFVFPIPLLFVAFFLMRGGGRRRYR